MRKFVRAASFPEWGKPAHTKSAIDPYQPYLQKRWQQGCRATGQLWHELQERSFSGSRMMVEQFHSAYVGSEQKRSGIQHAFL